MHILKSYNVGSADCTRIELNNGRQLLFDYADMKNHDDDDDLRCDLPSEIREDMGEETVFDIVAFTHLDKDHYHGATDFFYFEHIKKFQDDVNGFPRYTMSELWVPSAIITEQLAKTADSEKKAIQYEARERFKSKKGIRVFSRPERLRDWCKENDIDLDERRHLITDAGQLAPEINASSDDAEFFVHSPFAVRQDEKNVEDRNADSLVFHITFFSGSDTTKLFLSSDATCDILTDIVKVTEARNNKDRLYWDIFKLPHHCSHHSLSNDPREGDKTLPQEEVARLFEDYRLDNNIVISSSMPIPSKGSEEDKPGSNPPHRQAANYYLEDVVDADDFKVTMEHPTVNAPSPLIIEIGRLGPTVKKSKSGLGAAAAVLTRTPRAG